MHNKIIHAIIEKAREILPVGSRVTLYGSRARGDWHDDSDWDLQILIPGPEKISLESAINYAQPFDNLGLDFSEIINTRVYTFAGWLKRGFLPFYKNVTTEGIILYQS